MTLLAAPAEAAATRLRLLRVRDLDAFARLEPAWTSLQERMPDATVFSTWQWNAPAARQFARGRLDVRVFEDDGTVVGIGPLARRRHLGLRALLLVSGGLAVYSMADYGDLLMAPEREHDVIEALVDDLERDASWDELWLQELPETSQTALILPILARSRGWYVDIRDASETYTVELPSTPEEYLARLSQNTRKALRRRWNKLSREHDGTYHTIEPGEDPLPALETLFDLHTRRWEHEGQGGIFKYRSARAFHRDAVRGLHAAGMLDLTLLSADPSAGSGQGAPVAAQYCLDFNGRRLFYINGHEPSAEWQSFGLGFITDVARVEAAIATGLTTADFGRSEGEYKARYAPEGRQNLHLRVFRSRAAYLRCRLYLNAIEKAKPAVRKLLSILRKRRAASSPTAVEEQS